MDRDFFLGVATAAHQVEGNNIHSDCWVQENLPHSMYMEPSGTGVDHYNKFEEDLDYIKNAGMNAYRFTIEWARVEPEEGVYDDNALKHYDEVLRACEERGILPIVTLHHFSSPAWLIRKGGWKDEVVISFFARYCQKIAQTYGNRLSYVCTINEANMGMQLQKMIEEHMGAAQAAGSDSDASAKAGSDGPQVGMNTENPFEVMMLSMQESVQAFGRPDVNTYLDGRTMEQEKLVMRAHQAARKAIKEVLPEAKVGLTLSLFDIQALPGGEEIAKQLWYEDFGFYFDYMQEDDFIGIQNYTRKVVGPEGAVPCAADARLTDAGYEFYPEAIGNVVRRVAGLWDKELVVTENGVSTRDDSERQEFICTAMRGIRACLADGIKLKGYCHWSLLDNFEWQLGYAQQFGLIRVDRDTMKREVKQSLYVLGAEYKSLLAVEKTEK